MNNLVGTHLCCLPGRRLPRFLRTEPAFFFRTKGVGSKMGEGGAGERELRIHSKPTNTD